ncbi:hypothetical protein C8F01DRAFT_1117593 [Mycena amicta]|nr:hypothetical protein C8F01DRAFT_1117593 [Mycena amicta]
MLSTAILVVLSFLALDVAAESQQISFAITDMHPDSAYRPKTAESTACHRKKGKKKKNDAGVWGQPFSECDSPLRLTNFTLDFLERKVRTGDNARHDNDRKLPRTPSEIYDLNRAVAAKMASVFTSRGIPVVPSLGNNDNIMIPGPNSITNEFASIWKAFIPFPHLQIFQRGAYYAVEVVPDSLAVISLNTMFWYDSNKAVGGCLFTERDDAGNLQFDWLEVQLKGFRARNMQYVRYVELSLRFQDTILGHLYGHMNVDHFFFLEAGDLDIIEEPPQAKLQTDLFKSLMEDFAAIPKAKDINLDDYAVVSVAPSVVPNPYVPSFRVFSYNVTGAPSPGPRKDRKHGHHHGKGNKTAQCLQAEYRETWKCQLNETWHSDPEAPSRTNQMWTPLGYAQYFMPQLEEANKTHTPEVKLEYVTFKAGAVEAGIGKWFPIPPKNVPGSGLKKRQTAYGLGALTIGEWAGLARRVGRKEGLDSIFKSYMYLRGR